MSKYNAFFIVILLAAFVSFASVGVQAQETDINTLIKDVSVDTQKRAMFGYTYYMKFSYNHYKKFGGRKFTRVYEAILPSQFSLKRTYSHPFILIEDSEKQITNEDIADMRKRLIAELERAESEAEKNPNEEAEKTDGGYWTMNFSTDGKGVKIDIVKFLENSVFQNLQHKQINGGNVITLDFRPKPDAVFADSLSYLSKIEGQIWIDETDKRIIRIEGFPTGKFETNKNKTDSEREQEAVFLLIQTKVAEGFWFPKDVVLDFTKNPEIFKTIRVKFSFTNYKKSGVEIKSTEIKSPEAESVPATESEKKTN